MTTANIVPLALALLDDERGISETAFRALKSIGGTYLDDIIPHVEIHEDAQAEQYRFHLDYDKANEIREVLAARAKWTPRRCPVTPRQSPPVPRHDVDVEFRSH
jgi:hypothetical protein